MRMKFIVMSSLTGCLALLLGSAPGHSRLPSSQRGRPLAGDTSTTVPANHAQVALAEPPPRQETRPAVPPGWIDERFRRLDKDGDGYLSYDEMTENLKAEKDKWDTNKDGKIDLAEWREYIQALIAQRRRSASERTGSGRPGGTKGPTKGPGPRAPARARTDEGKEILQVLKARAEQNKKGTDPLPAKPESHLPQQFRQYDTNGDGQIALYEWKDKGGKVEEFLKLDLNGDGFITLDELMQAGYVASNPSPGQNAPGAMQQQFPGAFRGQTGKVLYIEVTGAIGGGVWGTDIYTDDSAVATAAVHAGVLKVGQAGVVKVTILPPLASYLGSTRHGVTTGDFGAFGGSYRVQAAPRGFRRPRK